MRKIDESLIPSGDSAYFKQGTWTHLQKAYIECLDSIVKSLIGSGYDTAKYYVLHGCVGTGTDPGARTISAGAIFHDGEIYLVPAASFTTTGADVAVGTITTAYNYSDYSVDPQTTPNGVSIELHAIRTIVFASGVSGSGSVNFSALVFYPFKFNYKKYTTLASSSNLTIIAQRQLVYNDGRFGSYISATYSVAIATNIIIATVIGIDNDTSNSDMFLAGVVPVKLINSSTSAETVAHVYAIYSTNGGVVYITIEPLTTSYDTIVINDNFNF